MKAMIMAAGLGTRLLPLTESRSKPCVPVANRPVIARIVELLAAHGFIDISANLYYHPDEIREVLGDGEAFGVSVRYVVESQLSGTAGGVGQFRQHLADGTFLVMSGDALTDADLSALVAAHRRHGGICTMAVKRVEDPSLYGVVVHDDRGRVVGFQEKPNREEARSLLCNCGIYVLEPEIFEYIPAGATVDFARDVFPALLADGRPFHVWRLESYWNDIGSLDVYWQGNYDALNGLVHISLPGTAIQPGVALEDGAEVSDDAVLQAPVVVGRGARIEAGARIVGPVVLGAACAVGKDAVLERSIVWDGCSLQPGSTVRSSLIGRQVLVGAGASVGPRAVVADGCSIAPTAQVPPEAHLAPGTMVLPAGRGRSLA